MTAKARARKGVPAVQAPRHLINHRDVAPLFGTSARNWRRWYTSGKVPVPHQQIGTLLLYDRAVINYRLETGRWPAGVDFIRQEGPPSQSVPTSDAETPTE